MRSSTFLIIIFCVQFFIGCNSSVTNFVKSARPNGETVPIQSNSPNGIKISPGKLEAASADISAEANATPTNQFMVGSDLSARVGISRTRVK